jgi:hypothetical protein
MLTEDNITLKVPYTEEQLAKIRTEMLELGKAYNIESFTCDDCGARYRCSLAFDLYNTQGDCLAEK